MGYVGAMFEKLFGSRSRPRVDNPCVPEGSRVYAIGDIHGRLDLLQAMHGLIAEDAGGFSGARKALVYLGDYIDRGMDSKAVIDLLIDAPLVGFEHVYLKGNHEQALLNFMDGTMLALDWMSYGGDATLYSYGVGFKGRRMDPDSHMELLKKFHVNLPGHHADFYRGLALTHGEGDYLFAHAGVRPGVPLGEQTATDILWIRNEFLDCDEDFGKVIVHGHSIMPEPEVKTNRIGIDTGAFATGRLSCLVLEGEAQRFLTT
jgi:serine/threonine protein phosphatase 1